MLKLESDADKLARLKKGELTLEEWQTELQRLEINQQLEENGKSM